LRALGLGDLLTGVPALRALRSALPSHELALATPAVLEPLVKLAAVADKVVDIAGLEDDDQLTTLCPRPDIAVNLHGRGPQSTRLLQSLEPQRLLAFGNADAGLVGPSWRADEHEAERWCRLVREGLGAPADPADLVIAKPSESAAVEGAVVIHPGAAFPSRRWPASRFAEVASWAAASGHAVVVTGSPGERQLAEQVAADGGLADTSVLAGRTGLIELAALVARARLVICGDTGVAHLATAFGTASVVLFGPVSPQLWGPPPGREHIALWRGGDQGDPWGESVDPALLEISVADVLEAAEGLLATS
jgi:ADP-heptose:LPS heptosyltransferase